VASRIAGRIRRAYAKKKGYRNLVYHFDSTGKDDEKSVHSWCKSLTIGNKFEWQNKLDTLDSGNYSNTLAKYCAISSAMHELECEKVLYMDPDSVIVNAEVDVSLNWPGTEDKTGERHVIWAYARWPVGLDSNNRSAWQVVDPNADDWCFAESNGRCGPYDKFASCVSPGALLVDNSQFSMDFLDRAIQTLLDVEAPKKDCSTTGLNQWNLDQCSTNDSNTDSCMTACTLKHASKNANVKQGESIVIPEEEFVCAGTGDGLKFQEVYLKDRPDEKPDKDTFIVSCPGRMLASELDEAQVKCIYAVIKMYPDLSEFFDPDYYYDDA
jgi:hypothetical protein